MGHWARAGEHVRLQYNVRWAAPEVVAADLDGVSLSRQQPAGRCLPRCLTNVEQELQMSQAASLPDR